MRMEQNYDEHQYLDLWETMAINYGRYGYPLGARPRPVVAEAGHYEVEIEYRGQVVSGQIELRDDPLLDD